MPFLILICFFYLVFADHALGQSMSTNPDIKAPLPSLKPRDQHSFDNFIKAIKELEEDAFLKGKSVLSIKTVTPRQVILDYKKSTKKADNIYKNKQTRIKAIVINFSRNAFNKYYIETHGDTAKDRVNIFINPRDTRFVQYKTGDKIDLVCYGQGAYIAFPSFDQCVFTTDYFNKQYHPIEQHLASATQANYAPLSQKELSTIILYKTLEQKIEVSCKKSISQCRSEIITELQNQAQQDNELSAQYLPLREKFANLPLLPSIEDTL